MSKIESWREVEEAHWEPISSLGHQWMIKSDASERGYSVMVTDGCGIWGEKRSARFILDQADEWASCIEAGITELSILVLSDVKKIAVASWENSRNTLKLSIMSKLNDMSYSWEFHLTRLDDELFNHHWTTPLLVHFHYLGTKISQLTKELESKNRQLEELLPDNKKTKTSNKPLNKNKVSPIEVSAEAVLTSGLSSVLEEQWSQYPLIMQSLQKIRNPENKQADVQKGQNATSNSARNKNHTERKTEEELEEEELRKQQERAARIQEIMHGNPAPTTPQKKKKKLKI